MAFYKLSCVEGGQISCQEHVIGNLVPKSTSVFLPLWSPQVFQLRETEEVLERMKLCRYLNINSYPHSLK